MISSVVTKSYLLGSPLGYTYPCPRGLPTDAHPRHLYGLTYYILFFEVSHLLDYANASKLEIPRFACLFYMVALCVIQSRAAAFHVDDPPPNPFLSCSYRQLRLGSVHCLPFPFHYPCHPPAFSLPGLCDLSGQTSRTLRTLRASISLPIMAPRFG